MRLIRGAASPWASDRRRKNPTQDQALYNLAHAAFHRMTLEFQQAFLEAAQLVHKVDCDQEAQQPGFNDTFDQHRYCHLRCGPFIEPY
jgi:hypothetical protein